jgi:uncharacterized protein DUF6455
MSVLIGMALAMAWLLLVAAAWRRALHDDASLPIFGMIDRNGTTADELAAVVGSENLALAVRRCALCGSKEQCRAWLASEPRVGRAAFCPTSALLEQRSGRMPA